MNFYRFSLSWPRILPTGYSNVVSKDGIAYYHRLLDELEKHNITPMVTLYHWDHPQLFQYMGGWTNEIIVELFADYARIVFEEFGDRVKIFSTINEPGTVCENGYFLGTHAPGILITLMFAILSIILDICDIDRQSIFPLPFFFVFIFYYYHANFFLFRKGLKLGRYGEYLCNQNILKAHARAYHIYDEEFKAKQKGQVGIVLNIINYWSKNKSDVVSNEVAFQFNFGIYAHPIFSKDGDWPTVIKQRVNDNSKFEGLPRSRLPSFSKEWIDYIK